MIIAGILLIAGASIAGMVNLAVSFATDSDDTGMIARHIGCGIVAVAGFVVLAFGVLGKLGWL